MKIVSLRLDVTNLKSFSNLLKQKNSAVLRDLINEGKKHKAVYLYKDKKVSIGLGARLAGVTLSEFIDLLKDHNINLNIQREDVEEALQTARKTL